MSSCQHCGEKLELDYSIEQAESVCTSCGAVISQSCIVNELTFDKSESSSSSKGGSNALVGNFLNSDGLTNYDKHRASRTTLGKALKRLMRIGAKLKMTHTAIETAFSFYKLTFTQGMLRGYKVKVSDGAVLYLTCRLEATPHMIIDFGDLLKVNIFEIGRLYHRLNNKLHLTLPLVDPWHYVMRFVTKLSLGTQVNSITTTALRIVGQMDRDWMSTGRHPSGLYGAALLLACRLAGCNKTVAEVSKVVRIHKTTIRKRLTELTNTASGKLSVKDYLQSDLVTEASPPCLTKSSNLTARDSDSESDNESAASCSSSSHTTASESVSEIIHKARHLQWLSTNTTQIATEWNERAIDELTNLSECANENTCEKEIIEENLDNCDFDDAEICSYILSEKEVLIKSRLWNEQFGEFEHEMQSKKDNEMNNKSKRRKSSRIELSIHTNSQTTNKEALEQIFNQTGLKDMLNIETMFTKISSKTFADSNIN